MIHEIRQGVQLIVRFQLRTHCTRTYCDWYCFAIFHAQHERGLGIGAHHERFIALVEIPEHKKWNIAHPKRLDRLIAIRMGTEWIFRMSPRNRQASGYKLESHFLSPHFALGSDRLQEIIDILIRDPDNQITIRMSSVKFTHLRDSPEKFLLIQEKIARIVVELALSEHRLGEWTMSFSTVATDKKIKILLYYRHAVVRVMAEFSEDIIRSSVH
ncbi:hypothetical protein A5769_06230 [Mycobacterium intracellulare]|nr:hypothetical protein A5769_06230 [Mycobacterium intracellulare]